MTCALVNPVPVIEDGRMTAKLPGGLLRGPGSIGGRQVHSP